MLKSLHHFWRAFNPIRPKLNPISHMAKLSNISCCLHTSSWHRVNASHWRSPLSVYISLEGVRERCSHVLSCPAGSSYWITVMWVQQLSSWPQRATAANCCVIGPAAGKVRGASGSRARRLWIRDWSIVEIFISYGGVKTNSSLQKSEHTGRDDWQSLCGSSVSLNTVSY